MHFIHWVFCAAIKRAPRAGQQIGYAQADDDRHQRDDELEAAHQILCVLHGAAGYRRLKKKIERELALDRTADWVAHASRVLGERVLAIANFSSDFTPRRATKSKESLFRRAAETNTRYACATQMCLQRAGCLNSSCPATANQDFDKDPPMPRLR